jgi:hypothetical protein
MKVSDHDVHFAVLGEAQMIYVDRDAKRGDLWRTRPPSHKLEMIQEKLDRAEYALENEQIGEYEESLLDLINFAVFAIRQVREGQRG